MDIADYGLEDHMLLIPISPNLVYKMKAISNKMQAIFFVDIDMVVIKHIKKEKK